MARRNSLVYLVKTHSAPNTLARLHDLAIITLFDRVILHGGGKKTF